MSLSSYPPLGQVTQTSEEEVLFYAILEIPSALVAGLWQVAVWHSEGDAGCTWAETILSRIGDGDEPSSLQLTDGTSTRLCFKARIPVRSSLRFTLKFRDAPERAWRWIRDEQGMDDGIVLSTAEAAQWHIIDRPEDIIAHLNPCLRIRPELSQSPGTQLWTFETTVDAANGDESSFTDIELGMPWGTFLRYGSKGHIFYIWTLLSDSMATLDFPFSPCAHY